MPADLDGARLVIVATPRRAVNRWIAKLSEARAIPVNVVDDREASRFIVPAIIDRDPVLVAVSTGRRLARLGASLARAPGGAHSEAAWAAWRRGCAICATAPAGGCAVPRNGGAISRPSSTAPRRAASSQAIGAARSVLLSSCWRAGSPRPRAAGEVTLVGAGPGDPELLTLRALRALQDADVILHDRLVSADILDLARRDATRICVGKTAGGAGTAQDRINDLLIEHARQGRRVVRLKGGDPFVFGRGGEELEALARAEINFSVVPGITAAAGCAAYAGIPLTHREYAHSVSFVTGHETQAAANPIGARCRCRARRRCSTWASRAWITLSKG